MTGAGASLARRLDVLDSFDPRGDDSSLRAEWTALAARSRNVFATPEFLSTWHRHFAADRDVALTPVRAADGRLLALAPLYRWRSRPLRVLRFLGHGAGDELGPICAPEDAGAAGAELRRLLASGELGCDVVLGEQLRGDAGWSSALGARVLAAEGSPVLHLDGTWDDYLSRKSRNLREQVRRRERKLAREHDVRFRLADGSSPLERDLAELFRLHELRWGAGGTHFARHADFHREFARLASERGWLRLWFLEVDGEPRAVWYGLRFAGVEWYYQAGRDPAWDERAVGFVLLVQTMRAALEDGVREYRFGRGGEEYKYRFADSDPGLETIAVARGAAGATAVQAARLARTVVRGARRLPRPRLR